VPASETGGNKVTVPMNFNDWTDYYGLLAHTSAKIPQADLGGFFA